MTTKLAIIVSLSIFFLSCSKESDLVQGESYSNFTTSSSKEKSTVGDRLDNDDNIVITSTHWLVGEGEIQAILEKVKDEAEGVIFPARRYVMAASGDAMSIEYARGWSELNLIYHTGAHQVQGSIVTEFYFGERLDLILDGNVTTRYDGDNVRISVNVKDAVFQSKTQQYKLTTGEVKFLLPKNPEGEVSIAISSTITLEKV